MLPALPTDSKAPTSGLSRGRISHKYLNKLRNVLPKEDAEKDSPLKNGEDSPIDLLGMTITIPGIIRMFEPYLDHSIWKSRPWWVSRACWKEQIQ